MFSFWMTTILQWGHRRAAGSTNIRSSWDTGDIVWKESDIWSSIQLTLVRHLTYKPLLVAVEAHLVWFPGWIPGMVQELPEWQEAACASWRWDVWVGGCALVLHKGPFLDHFFSAFLSLTCLQFCSEAKLHACWPHGLFCWPMCSKGGRGSHRESWMTGILDNS